MSDYIIGHSIFLWILLENCLSFVHIRKQCSCFLLYVITFIFRYVEQVLYLNKSPLLVQYSNINWNGFFFLWRNPVVGLLAFGENSDPSIQSWTSFPFNLKKDVDHLWIFLGPINTLPNSSFLKLEETSVSTSQQLTPSAHWLHLHLELKWGVLEILSRLYNSLGMFLNFCIYFELVCEMMHIFYGTVDWY